MKAPHRPLCRYYGGKWHLAPWIIAAMPVHRVYTESFAGAASVLLRKPRAEVEVLSDLDLDVVWLLRVAADPNFSQLLAGLARFTPYERESVEKLAGICHTDFVNRALRAVIRGAMTRSAAIQRSNGRVAGFREDCGRARRDRLPSEDWSTWPDAMPAFQARLAGVEVLHQPAVQTLIENDAEDAVHFVDPPYLPSARSAPEKGYAHDMSESDHVDLLGVLRSLRGAVLLSGYDSDLYRDGLPGWRRLERVSIDAGGSRRVESLWLNQAAAARSPATAQSGLFDVAAEEAA